MVWDWRNFPSYSVLHTRRTSLRCGWFAWVARLERWERCDSLHHFNDLIIPTHTQHLKCAEFQQSHLVLKKGQRIGSDDRWHWKRYIYMYTYVYIYIYICMYMYSIQTELHLRKMEKLCEKQITLIKLKETAQNITKLAHQHHKFWHFKVRKWLNLLCTRKKKWSFPSVISTKFLPHQSIPAWPQIRNAKSLFLEA